MNQDLISQIELKMPSFSKGQKSIAKYIIERYDKAAYMTASRLGSTVGVSESTVVRFASELGFDGYPQLQKELQEYIRNKLTTVQRIEVTSDRIGSNDLLEKVLFSDIENIKKTLAEVSRQDFEGAVNAINNAKKIYILGIRSASVLANFLGFYLSLIFENVIIVHTTSMSEMFEQILRIDKDDVVVGISFPRYSSKTLKGLKYASDRGATVIALTDSLVSPLTRFAKYSLLARSDMASFVDSLVAPLSLINALIVAIGIKRSEYVYKTFAELERIWAEYDVYEKVEDNKLE